MAPFEDVFTHEPNDRFIAVDMGLRREQNRETGRRNNDEQSNEKRVATQQNQFTAIREYLDAALIGRRMKSEISPQFFPKPIGK